MFGNILVNTLGAIIFLFLFWRRLKEDYSAEMIFSTFFYALFSLLLLSLFAGKYFPLWWFWSSVLGLFLGLTLGVLRFKLRFFETLEALVLASIPWLSFVFLKNAITTSNTSSFIASLATFVFIVLFVFLDNNYKQFTWYKSGRVGFTGLTTLGIFFLTRGFIAAFNIGVLSFVGRLDGIISAVVSFLSFLAVYNLARDKS